MRTQFHLAFAGAILGYSWQLNTPSSVIMNPFVFFITGIQVTVSGKGVLVKGQSLLRVLWICMNCLEKVVRHRGKVIRDGKAKAEEVQSMVCRISYWPRKEI